MQDDTPLTRCFWAVFAKRFCKPLILRPAVAQVTVPPMLNCVYYDQTDNLVTAYFGYSNVCSGPGKSAKLASSLPNGSSWQVSCLHGAAEAVAVCLPAR